MFETPAPIEIEFRNGRRQVPEYIAVLLSDIPTHRLTYDEAIEFANRRMEADYLNAQRDRILAAHFRELR